MYLLLSVIGFAVNLYIGVIILQVLLNWLIIFEVISVKNTQAQNLIGLLNRLTDPLFKPLRKYIPSIGGIDITPIIVILGLNLLMSMLVRFLVGVPFL